MAAEKGWIKLWRKTKDNDIWKYDRTAWHIFEYFLMTCDRQNGTIKFGRFQLAEILNINPSTLYKAIKRLEKAKMVTQVSNNKFTIISICNWKLYQGNGNSVGNNNNTNYQVGNNKVTTKTALSNNQITDIKDGSSNNKKNKKDGFGNTIQEYKNKEIKNKNIYRQRSCPEANEITNFYKETYGFKKSIPKYLENWRAAKWLYEQYGVERTCQAILAGKVALEESIAGAEKVPIIKNLMDLKEKYDQLRAYYGRKRSQNKKTIDLSKI